MTNVSGVYSEHYSTNSLCDSVAFIELQYYPIINPIIEITHETCEDTSSGVIEIVSPMSSWRFSLSGSTFQNEFLFTDLSAGEYLLAIEDGNNCIYEQIVTIQAGKLLEITPTATLNLEDSTPYFALEDIDDEAISSVSWSPTTELSCSDCLHPEILAEETITYEIELIDTAGCNYLLERTYVIEKDKPSIYIPNVFSPNGDGANDFFNLFATEGFVQHVALQIFDRNGGLIYSNPDFAFNSLYGWDGTWQGKRLNIGVYVYLFEIQFTDGRKEVISGDITLVR